MEPATEEAEHNGDTCLGKSHNEAMRIMEGVLDKVKDHKVHIQLMEGEVEFQGKGYEITGAGPDNTHTVKVTSCA